MTVSKARNRKNKIYETLSSIHAGYCHGGGEGPKSRAIARDRFGQKRLEGGCSVIRCKLGAAAATTVAAASAYELKSDVSFVQALIRSKLLGTFGSLKGDEMVSDLYLLSLEEEGDLANVSEVLKRENRSKFFCKKLLKLSN